MGIFILLKILTFQKGFILFVQVVSPLPLCHFCEMSAVLYLSSQEFYDATMPVFP